MNDLIILFITFGVLLVLFMLTIINVLSHHKHKADAAWNELDRFLVVRRDTVPCMLESARIKDTRWNALMKLRNELMKNGIDRTERIDLEVKLGNAIEAFSAVAKEYESVAKNTVFLEAEKDLRKDTAVDIKKAYEKWRGYEQEYQGKRQSFPYNLVRILGF